MRRRNIKAYHEAINRPKEEKKKKAVLTSLPDLGAFKMKNDDLVNLSKMLALQSQSNKNSMARQMENHAAIVQHDADAEKKAQSKAKHAENASKQMKKLPPKQAKLLEQSLKVAEKEETEVERKIRLRNEKIEAEKRAKEEEDEANKEVVNVLNSSIRHQEEVTDLKYFIMSQAEWLAPPDDKDLMARDDIPDDLVVTSQDIENKAMEEARRKEEEEKKLEEEIQRRLAEEGLEEATEHEVARFIEEVKQENERKGSKESKDAKSTRNNSKDLEAIQDQAEVQRKESMRQMGLAPSGMKPLNVYCSHHSETRLCKTNKDVPSRPDFKVRIAKIVEMEAAAKKAEKEKQAKERQRAKEAEEEAVRQHFGESQPTQQAQSARSPGATESDSPASSPVGSSHIAGGSASFIGGSASFADPTPRKASMTSISEDAEDAA